MTARIIQTNKTPLRKVKVEGVTVDIIENALKNARVEMDAVLFRTAMSPGIREQDDAFPLIADHTGRMIVGQFGSFIGGFLDGYEGTVEEGDMFFLSDPYSCDGAISHSNDWLVLLPVFKNGRLLAYSVDADTIYAVPTEITDAAKTAAAPCDPPGYRTQKDPHRPARPPPPKTGLL